MSDRQPDVLLARLRKKASAATQAFLNGEEDAADLAWIEKATTLVTAMSLGKVRGSRIRQQALPFALTLACMIAPVVLLMTPVRNLLVTIRLDTAALTITLGEPWELHPPISADSVFVDRVMQVASPELGIAPKDKFGDLQITAEGGKITVQSLTVTPLPPSMSDQRGTLIFQARGDEFTLLSQGNTVKGQLAVSANAFLSIGLEGERPTIAAVERVDLWTTVDFLARNEGAALSKLAIRSNRGWKLDGFWPTGIRFDVPNEGANRSGDEIFESAIKSGTIRIHDEPSREIQLEEGDRVAINGTVVTELMRLEHDDGMHLVFRGTVEEIAVGARDYERNVAPNMLEYVYFNWPVGAFMGIFALLSVLLLSVPKLLVS
jgi:hypothetical protein